MSNDRTKMAITNGKQAHPRATAPQKLSTLIVSKNLEIKSLSNMSMCTACGIPFSADPPERVPLVRA
jgi:hypothetical protein